MHYMVIVYAMVVASAVLVVAGLLGAHFQRKRKALEAIIDGTDSMDDLPQTVTGKLPLMPVQADALGQDPEQDPSSDGLPAVHFQYELSPVVGDVGNDVPEEQEVLHMLLWDPFIGEPLDAKEEIIPMTVLQPDGKEVQISIAVRPETARAYLSRKGGPKAFKDAIVSMQDRPGWCLAATSGGVMEPTALPALYDVIVGQMVDGGDVDGWLDTLQAYWEYEVGYDDSFEDEVTAKIDMRMTHPDLDVAPVG